jgi:hypothetical protein
MQMSTAKLEEFRSTAHGYDEINENVEGSIVWLRKAAPDIGTDVHQRLCIYSIVTVQPYFGRLFPRS